jgi:WD40 repeat protein
MSIYAINNIVIAGYSDGYINTWNIETGDSLISFKGHDKCIMNIFAIENIIISGSLDNYIKLWNIKTGICFKELNEQYPINSMAINSNAIITCVNKRIRIRYFVTRGKILTSLMCLYRMDLPYEIIHYILQNLGIDIYNGNGILHI